eukprot:gene4920-10536_t
MAKILGVSVLAFAVLLVSGEEPSEADLSTQERLAQLKKLAEFKRSQDAAKNSPPKLEDGDILITGRVGVNQLVNGHFKLKGQQYHGRPSYEKLKKVNTGPEAIDLAVWWSSGKWYVGLLTEIGTDAAYAFVPSQAMIPEAANSIWSIWDGSKWLADTNIKCTGTGNRKLHVGDVNSHKSMDDDDDYQEYLAQREQEEADYEDDEEPVVKRPYNPEAPEPVEGKAPKRLKFKPTCPEGHPGCSPHNMGQCMSAGSGMTSYIAMGVVAVALVGIAIFLFLKDKRQPARSRGVLG